MKIKLSELRKLIREELSSSHRVLPGRQLGYGEGEGSNSLRQPRAVLFFRTDASMPGSDTNSEHRQGCLCH